MVTTATVQKIASELRTSGADGDALDRAKATIAAGGADDLLSSLLALEATESADQDAAIKKTMTLLESIADVDFAVAGSLMVRLAFVASDAFMHDVCDAVGLWVENMCKPELARLGSMRGRPNGEIWDRWREMLDERCRREAAAEPR